MQNTRTLERQWYGGQFRHGNSLFSEIYGIPVRPESSPGLDNADRKIDSAPHNQAPFSNSLLSKARWNPLTHFTTSIPFAPKVSGTLP